MDDGRWTMDEGLGVCQSSAPHPARPRPCTARPLGCREGLLRTRAEQAWGVQLPRSQLRDLLRFSRPPAHSGQTFYTTSSHHASEVERDRALQQWTRALQTNCCKSGSVRTAATLTGTPGMGFRGQRGN